LIVGIVLKTNPTATWAVYLDAGASAAIVVFVLWSTVPLVKRVSIVMMQSVPPSLNVEALRGQLRNAAPGISEVHELHVWCLNEQMTIATVHVMLDSATFADGAARIAIHNKLTAIFHSLGVHSSTIQMENDLTVKENGTCSMRCVDACDEAFCCTPNDQPAVANRGVFTGK